MRQSALMTQTPDCLCIGSALWDIIGQTDLPMVAGNDKPGQITRRPGGVVLNIAAGLAERGVVPMLLSAVGRDAEGEALIEEITAKGILCDNVHRMDAPTDRYMAIEAQGQILGAIADCASLEREGEALLEPLRDGRLGSPTAPYTGLAVIDGNLPIQTIEAIVAKGDLASARTVFAPASPGKADRMAPVLGQPGVTLFLNRGEAEIVLGATFENSTAAAKALAVRNTAAVVTDGHRAAAVCRDDKLTTLTPPQVVVRSATGAGDAFLAGFLAAEINGADDHDCLQAALDAGAAHVSGAAA